MRSSRRTLGGSIPRHKSESRSTSPELPHIFSNNATAPPTPSPGSSSSSPFSSSSTSSPRSNRSSSYASRAATTPTPTRPAITPSGGGCGTRDAGSMPTPRTAPSSTLGFSAVAMAVTIPATSIGDGNPMAATFPGADPVVALCLHESRDSIGRNQWESFLCMLAKGVQNKSSIYEKYGNPITKHKGFLSMVFHDYNLTVEYYRAPFLAAVGRPPPASPDHVRAAIHLDALHWLCKHWVDADLLVLNAGHWWNDKKTIAA
ncbi:hypothetical protein GW17_00037682 [Ensete ventricosum]|nr:hypothetical protein GW17_00037682 [Ensete ventricosum]